jgi:hypothetical protein
MSSVALLRDSVVAEWCHCSLMYKNLNLLSTVHVTASTKMMLVVTVLLARGKKRVHHHSGFTLRTLL